MLKVFLLCVIVATAGSCEGSAVVRILGLHWLTFGSDILRNDEVYSASAILPVALDHFNARESSVIPALAALKGKCNVSLQLTDGQLLDTGGLPNVAMAMFIRRYSRRAFDMVHVIRSEVVQPIAVTAGALNYPVISPIGSSDALSNKLVYPTFFRTSTQDSYKADLVAKLLRYQFKYRALGLVYVDDAFGTALRAALQTSCASFNIRLVAAGYRASATGKALQDEARRALKVLVDERIRVIYHAGLDDNFYYALVDAVYALDWLNDRVFIANRQPPLSLLSRAPDRNKLLRMLRGTLLIASANQDGNAQFESMMQVWPSINVTQVNTRIPNATARNGVPLRLPANYFTSKLQEARTTFRGWTYAYDSIMAIGLAACSRQMSGKRTDSLVSYLAGITFEGVSGAVSFDSQFNRVGDVYALFNIQLDGVDAFKPVRVGSVVGDGNWTVDWSNIQFDDGTNNLPVDIDPPTHQVDKLTTGAIVWGIIEASVAVSLSVITLLYLVRHRTDQAFVESQPVFMFLLACGCLSMGVSIAGLVVETDVGCMLFPWLFSLGFTLSLASLTAKSMRVAVLWYSRGPLKQRNQSVRATVLLGGIGLTMLGLIALLTAWQIVAPLVFVISTTKRDLYDFPLYSSAMCVTEHPLSTTFLALVITYVCIVVFVTMWVSFWVRNAPEKFQETRMASIAGVSMFQVFFVGIPTATAVWNMALPRFLVLSSLTFLLCCIILCTMFLPKVLRDRFGIERSSDVDNNGAQDMRSGEVNEGGESPRAVMFDKGVLTNRGKKRKRLAQGSSEEPQFIRSRSFVERVLESVQEIHEEENPQGVFDADDSSTNQPYKASDVSENGAGPKSPSGSVHRGRS